MSSDAVPAFAHFGAVMLVAGMLAGLWRPVAAAAQEGAGAAPPPERPRFNVLVTVPRGEPNASQARECAAEAEASTISGEIVVCGDVIDDGRHWFSGSRSEAQRRYAQESAFAGAPPPPNVFGIPDNGSSIGFGKAPPPALIVDFAALPQAPPGSDADRIARGLPPLEAAAELSPEEEQARREAAGIRTVPPPPPPPRAGRKKGG